MDLNGGNIEGGCDVYSLDKHDLPLSERWNPIVQ